MRNYIIISKKQADAVRGRHGKYSALEPVEFPDGRYGIPARCIDDHEFAGIKKTLEEYARGEIQEIKDLVKRKENIEIEAGVPYLYKDYVIQSDKDYWTGHETMEETVRMHGMSVDEWLKTNPKASTDDLVKLSMYEESEIEVGKYYLSEDYWVVLAKTTERISLEGIDKLSDLSDKFEIRKDIKAEADKLIDERIALEREKEPVKEPEGEIEEPAVKPRSIMAPMAVAAEEPEVPEVIEVVEEPVKEGFFKRLWNKIRKVFRKRG